MSLNCANYNLFIHDEPSPQPLTSFQLILPVSNEVLRIKDTLDYFVPRVGRITVVDNFSSDGTADLVKNLYPDVSLYQLSNQGTTETSDYWKKISAFFSMEYILFASCSEILPPRLLALFDAVASANVADLLSVGRRSITGSSSTDPLYYTASSFFLPSPSVPSVIRLVRWSKLDPALIVPHDSFKSQKQCICLSIKGGDDSFCIYHLRQKPSLRTLQKHTAYAKLYALYKCRSNILLAICDSSLRILLDSLRLLFSLVYLRFNSVILLEYTLRIVMHIQVCFFAIFPKL